MSHRLTALIGPPSCLSGLAARFGPPAPRALPFGLILVPLDEERLDLLARFDDMPAEGFTYLVPALEEAIGAAVPGGRVLYVETGYFGGIGSQGAALFEDGRLVWRRAVPVAPAGGLAGAKTPISRGLAELGVRARPGGDEFDAVGLGAFRSFDHFER